MSFKYIKKDSTTEMVINQIKEEIKNGNLKSGEKLPSERKLAEILGVSRTSVREAIQALSFSGYLKVFQGKGAYVTENAKKYDEISVLLSTVSDYSLSSLMEVREMLESECVRLATIRANENEIKNICDSFKAMKNSKSIREFVREDLNFHLAITEATHNPLMNALMKVFGEMLHKETNEIVEHSINTRDRTLEITEKLVEALKNRESEKAKQLMISHMQVIEKSIEDN